MQGSIRKRVGKRGTVWTAVVDLPRDPATGRRRQKRITAPTKKQAEESLTKALRELQTSTYTEASRLTVGQWLREWFASHPCRESSRIRYERDLRRWLLPGLGHVPLAQLRSSTIQAFYQQRLASGASPAAIRTHAKILRRALGEAVRQRLIGQNVAQLVRVPREEHRELQVWNRSEMVYFPEHSADDSLALLYEMALKTGMRRGELLALRWRDIDLNHGWLSVQRTLTEGEQGWTVGDVKTKAARRRIALSPLLCPKLRAHRDARPRAIDSEHDLVFPTSTGRAMHPSFVGVCFQRLQRRLGIERRIRFHDLRHTFATLALANGASMKAVSAQLGHASITVTMDRYAHVTEDMMLDLTERMEMLAGR
jgi:integrase